MPSFPYPLDGTQSIYFPPIGRRKGMTRTVTLPSVKETKSPLCSLYILFICYSGKRCTDVFHYYLALTVHFKNSLSSPLAFCKGLSFTISHFYAFLLYNSSYLSCPSLILIQILFCFSRNTWVILFSRELENYQMSSCTPCSTFCHNLLSEYILENSPLHFCLPAISEFSQHWYLL